VSSSADRDALSRGYANASLARVRRISNFAASTRGSPRPPRPPRLQAFSIPITACAARFSSKDGQQTIWFRGGLTVRISSSPQVSPALGAVLVEGRGQGLLNPPAGCRVGRKPGAPPEGLAATHAGQRT